MDKLLTVIIAVTTCHLVCGQQRIAEDCLQVSTGRTCYTLYGVDGNIRGYTWEEARIACENNSARLVKINSREVQEKIASLTRPIASNSGEIHVWTSGIKSEAGTWITAVGDTLPEDWKVQAGGRKCGFIEVGQLSTTNCTNKIARVLCQSSERPCQSPDFLVNNICYHVVYVPGESWDWLRARQLCTDQPGRDIAYKLDDFNGIIQELKKYNLLFDGLWIGYTTLHFKWYTGLVPGDILSYTKFRSQDVYADCIYVDPKDDNKWATKSCLDPNTHYICEQYKQYSSPSTTTSTTSTTSTPTTTTTSTSTTTTSTILSTPATNATGTTSAQAIATIKQVTDDHVTGAGNASSVPPLPTKYIIAIAVAGGALIIVIVIVVAVVARRRRKMAGEADDSAYNTHIHSGSTTGLNYGTVSDLSSNIYTETPGDYAEVNDGHLVPGGSQGGVPTIRYKEPVAGVLYALPDRKHAAKSPTYENS